MDGGSGSNGYDVWKAVVDGVFGWPFLFVVFLVGVIGRSTLNKVVMALAQRAKIPLLDETQPTPGPPAPSPGDDALNGPAAPKNPKRGRG